MSSLRGLTRREFSAKTKGLRLKHCMRNGAPHCEVCGIELNARTGLHYDHHDPDGLGGEPTLENCRVLCRTCHSIKTISEDQPRMAKADRTFKAYHNIKHRKGPPMPGSRASGIKKRMDGTVERRQANRIT